MKRKLAASAAIALALGIPATAVSADTKASTPAAMIDAVDACHDKYVDIDDKGAVTFASSRSSNAHSYNIQYAASNSNDANAVTYTSATAHGGDKYQELHKLDQDEVYCRFTFSYRVTVWVGNESQ